jgi:hypothetical protein
MTQMTKMSGSRNELVAEVPEGRGREPWSGPVTHGLPLSYSSNVAS